MIFESTTDLLLKILNLLRTGDESSWKESLEYGKGCVYELSQMSRPSRRANLSGRIDVAAFERSARALPHVKAMNAAIRQGDRNEAIRSATAAVAEMGGARPFTGTAATRQVRAAR